MATRWLQAERSTGSVRWPKVNDIAEHHLALLWRFSCLRRGGILFSGCACVRPLSHRTKTLLTRYLIKRLQELHQIYNFGAIGDKDETIKFCGQKVKGQGHSETKCTLMVEATKTI